jgi:glutamine synthetase
MEIGVTTLPRFPKDATDRNRTSPFAFTGNKFEFRMLGSAFSAAGPNIVLNTVVADALGGFADELERAGAEGLRSSLARVIRETYARHKRVIFNGNNYSEEWVAEAKRRGLSNLRTTVDALPEFVAPKNAAVFERSRVFTEQEMRSRYEIMMDAYCKTIHIEALCMIDMTRQKIIPACVASQNVLARRRARRRAGGGNFDNMLEHSLLGSVSRLSAHLLEKLTVLENAAVKSREKRGVLAGASFYRDAMCPAMAELRAVADELESLVASKYWPLPTYAELLYSVE